MGLQREAPGSTPGLCEEPETKMGKLETQPTMGQKEKESCVPVVKGTWRRCGGPAQGLSTPGLQAEVSCRNVSFAFERITEPRESIHLLFRILRLVRPVQHKHVFLRGANELPSSPHVVPGL